MKGMILICGLIALGVIGGALLVNSAYFTLYEVSGTVNTKYIDVGKDESYYVVVLTDGQLLEVDRNPIDWNPDHNPDRVYPAIEANKTYTFTCWGWIWDWAYWYPNVIEIEEIS